MRFGKVLAELPEKLCTGFLIRNKRRSFAEGKKCFKLRETLSNSHKPHIAYIAGSSELTIGILEVCARCETPLVFPFPSGHFRWSLFKSVSPLEVADFAARTASFSRALWRRRAPLGGDRMMKY